MTRGIKDFVIGIGGSATNDCGLGMMESLGARFFDANGELVGGTGDDVKRVAEADLGDLLKLTRGAVSASPAMSRIRSAERMDAPLCSVRRKAGPPICSPKWMRRSAGFLD